MPTKREFSRLLDILNDKNFLYSRNYFNGYVGLSNGHPVSISHLSETIFKAAKYIKN